MMRLEILAETPQDFALKLRGLFDIFLRGSGVGVGVDATRVPVGGQPDNDGAEPGPAVEAETVEPPKRPRGRPPKAQQIDGKAEAAKSDPKPEEAAPADPEPEVVEEPVGDSEAELAPKKYTAPKAYTFDETKALAISYANAYKLAHPENPEALREAFKSLLDQFGVVKFADLPAEKYGEMVALVEKKTAELDAEAA